MKGSYKSQFRSNKICVRIASQDHYSVIYEVVPVTQYKLATLLQARKPKCMYTVTF